MRINRLVTTAKAKAPMNARIPRPISRWTPMPSTSPNPSSKARSVRTANWKAGPPSLPLSLIRFGVSQRTNSETGITKANTARPTPASTCPSRISATANRHSTVADAAIRTTLTRPLTAAPSCLYSRAESPPLPHNHREQRVAKSLGLTSMMRHRRQSRQRRIGSYPRRASSNQAPCRLSMPVSPRRLLHRACLCTPSRSWTALSPSCVSVLLHEIWQRGYFRAPD